MLKPLQKSGNRCSGQALVEYALILLLITVVVLIAVTNLGQGTDSNSSKVNDSLQQADYGK